MSKTVYISELAEVSIPFPGDFRELASLLLRGFDSLNQGTNAKTRPTLHGVSSAFTRLFVDRDRRMIEGKLLQMGFDLGATVEWNDEGGRRGGNQSAQVLASGPFDRAGIAARFKHRPLTTADR